MCQQLTATMSVREKMLVFEKPADGWQSGAATTDQPAVVATKKDDLSDMYVVCVRKARRVVFALCVLYELPQSRRPFEIVVFCFCVLQRGR
jgi:hypothetical protein